MLTPIDELRILSRETCDLIRQGIVSQSDHADTFAHIVREATAAVDVIDYYATHDDAFDGLCRLIGSESIPYSVRSSCAAEDLLRRIHDTVARISEAYLDNVSLLAYGDRYR